MTSLEAFNEIDDYKALQIWATEGKNTALTPALNRYLDQLEVARTLYSKYKSQQFIVKILMKTNQGLSRKGAIRLMNESLNFFYQDNEVKKDAWRNIYAEKLENAALVAWNDGDMEIYRRCIISAAEMRGLNIAEPPKIPDNLYDRRVVIYQMDPRKVRLKTVSRATIAKFIDSLDMTEIEKEKARRDAGVTPIEFDEYAEDCTEGE